MDPGFRLRQIRERLGLTYRDVQRASLALAREHTCPHFTLHLSRLADIENRGSVPSVHKLYALAVVYHVNPLEILRWYRVPMDKFLGDAVSLPLPRTTLMEPPEPPRAADTLTQPSFPTGTEFMPRDSAQRGAIENILSSAHGSYRYGCIGLEDRRMEPILRPGSVVLVDVSVRRLQETHWPNEYDRPLYFVELHEGYRCGWFQQEGSRLAMQPHPLSRCMPESWKTPDDAEIVGRVVGLVTRLPGPVKALPRESPEWPAHSSRRVP